MSDKSQWWGGCTLIRPFTRSFTMVIINRFYCFMEIPKWLNANMLNFTKLQMETNFRRWLKICLKKPAILHKWLYFQHIYEYIHSFYCHAFFKLFSVTFTYANVVFIFIEIGRAFQIFFFSFSFSLCCFIRSSTSTLFERDKKKIVLAMNEWNDAIPNKTLENPCISWISLNQSQGIPLSTFTPRTQPKFDQAQFQISTFLLLVNSVCFSLFFSWQLKINSSIYWMDIYASSELIWNEEASKQ